MEPEIDLEKLLASSDPSLTLTEDEKELLRRYLPFYRALESGRRKPSTQAQEHFVAVCEGGTKAETQHELAYVKYMRLRPKPEPVWREDWHSWLEQER
jgi:uncharacterized protein YifE (UPF0438 family)